jgi:hypothetical protein
MDFVAFVIIVAVSFLAGWMTGNIVEWVLTNRDRRVLERDAADELQRMLKGRDHA